MQRKLQPKVIQPCLAEIAFARESAISVCEDFTESIRGLHKETNKISSNMLGRKSDHLAKRGRHDF